MRKLTLTTALILASTAANAFSLPAHVRDGYRDTGCDASLQVDLGGYSNNPSCPDVPGLSDAEREALEDAETASNE